jgi:pterin-4a-carbinolamine dehydratase
MSSSSSNDSYSASSPIPSLQELSHLITEPDSLHAIAHKFTSKPTSTAILLSQSIAQLEEELEHHQLEWEVRYNHLFNNQSFQTGIHLIVNEYRQKRALIHQGFHPYSRTSGSPRMSSADNPPSTNNPPSIEQTPHCCNG